MRTFLAFPVPDELRLLLWKETEPLRRSASGVKWVSPESMHLTLFFFGEIGDDQVQSLAELLADPAFGRPPLTLGYRGLGAFPSIGKPRVIVIELTQGVAECLAFRERIEPAVRRVAASDERPFSPHLTLGRVKIPGAKLDLSALAITPREFTISRCVLYESRLRREGPEYRELAALEFHGR